MNIKRYTNRIKTFNAKRRIYIPEINPIKAWISELYCYFRFGASPDDYYRYEFYKKTDFERTKFITFERSRSIIRKFNDPQYWELLEDKGDFNSKFEPYLNRDWLDLRKTKEEDFRSFVLAHNEVIMKPLKGGQGRGIFKFNSSDLDDFNFSSHKEYLCEEVLKQHPIMASINKSSVNTIRVLTFKGKVIACALRSGGKDDIVDNLHADGICAHVDIETGIIDYPCKTIQLKKYLIHPSSGTKMIGLQIPNWNKLISTAEEVSKVVPSLQYVGWDFAILDDKVALIEGNHDPGHSICQMISQIGIYDKVKE